MTIRVDITHVAVEKFDKNAEPDILYVSIKGQGLTRIYPGGGETFYVHKAQDINVFYDRRSEERRRR